MSPASLLKDHIALATIVAPGHPAIGTGGIIVQASAPTYSEPVPTVGSVINSAPPPSPASFWNELKNPATWATIAAYIPTFWGVFNLPSKGLPIALGIVHIAAILAGPIATVAYAIAHAMKASAHESRLAQIESAAVTAFMSIEGVPGIVFTDVEKELLSVISAFRPAPKPLPPSR